MLLTNIVPTETMNMFLAYGPLGGIAVMFFITANILLNMGNKLFKDTLKNFDDQSKQIYELYAMNNEMLRGSLENHNTRTLELLTEIKIELTKSDIYNKQLIDSLESLVKNQISAVDDIRATAAEIRLLCPMQNKYRLGELLVSKGIISREQLEEVLKDQHRVDN